MSGLGVSGSVIVVLPSLGRLFTVELLRELKERGDLVRDGDGCWVEGPSLDWDVLPVKVEGVIAERIGRLDQDLQDLLTVACVEGEEFTAEVVAQVEALSEREVVRRLGDDLQRRHRLVSELGAARSGGLRLSRYRFAHALFQQYVYGGLDAAERACLHELQAGCHAPVGTIATVEEQHITLHTVVLSADGSQRIEAEQTGDVADGEEVGRSLARELLELGAAPLIAPPS